MMPKVSTRCCNVEFTGFDFNWSTFPKPAWSSWSFTRFYLCPWQINAHGVCVTAVRRSDRIISVLWFFKKKNLVQLELYLALKCCFWVFCATNTDTQPDIELWHQNGLSAGVGSSCNVSFIQNAQCPALWVQEPFWHRAALLSPVDVVSVVGIGPWSPVLFSPNGASISCLIFVAWQEPENVIAAPLGMAKNARSGRNEIFFSLSGALNCVLLAHQSFHPEVNKIPAQLMNGWRACNKSL